MLSVQNVSKAFGGIKAVDGGSLDVKKGSITGLIGPNGSGKTTLFNIITGFYPPDSGEITSTTNRSINYCQAKSAIAGSGGRSRSHACFGR